MDRDEWDAIIANTNEIYQLPEPVEMRALMEKYIVYMAAGWCCTARSRRSLTSTD